MTEQVHGTKVGTLVPVSFTFEFPAHLLTTSVLSQTTTNVAHLVDLMQPRTRSRPGGVRFSVPNQFGAQSLPAPRGAEIRRISYNSPLEIVLAVREVVVWGAPAMSGASAATWGLMKVWQRYEELRRTRAETNTAVARENLETLAYRAIAEGLTDNRPELLMEGSAQRSTQAARARRAANALAVTQQVKQLGR